MHELDDITIQSAAHGDARSFKRVYEHYSPYVWKIIYRTVNGDSDAAKQILQDVFVRVFETLSSFRFKSLFSTWLYRLTFNQALGYLKKRKKQRDATVPFDEQRSRSTHTIGFEDREFVATILHRLAPEERFLLVAREVDTIPFEELSRITGQSAGALRIKLHRIKETVKQYGNAAMTQRGDTANGDRKTILQRA